MRPRLPPNAHDRYKGVKETGVVAVLQAPGETPILVDIKMGYDPKPPTSNQISNENQKK